MLNPEFKAKWLEALRSGKYEQGTCTLHRRTVSGSSRYCCLGVACELHPRFQGWEESSPATGTTVHFLVGGGGFSASLPPGWLDDIGLFVEHSDTLVQLNDQENYTFAEIADYIEENL